MRTERKQSSNIRVLTTRMGDLALPLLYYSPPFSFLYSLLSHFVSLGVGIRQTAVYLKAQIWALSTPLIGPIHILTWRISSFISHLHSICYFFIIVCAYSVSQVCYWCLTSLSILSLSFCIRCILRAVKDYYTLVLGLGLLITEARGQLHTQS